MFRHQELIWFIGCVFYTPCPTCALLMSCSCIAHSHLMHKPLLPLLGLGLYLVSSSLTCHVYFILCSILFLRCFAFCFHFISNSCCTIHASLSLFFFLSFLSLILLGPFVYSCQKGGEYIGEYTRESIGLVRIHRGRNSIGKMHILGGRRHIFIRKPFFFTLCLFSCFLYDALSYFQFLCFVVLIASCLCVEHAYILMLLCFNDCMFG